MDVVTTADVDPDEVLSIVSVAMLKKNLRISHSKEDDVAAQSILAAYDWLANPTLGWLNRALITQTYQAVLPGFQKEQTYSSRASGGPAVRWVPTSSIVLPKPPLVSVQSITYLTGGVVTTLATDQYSVKTSGTFGNVSLVYQKTWPTVDVDDGAVKINFTAGYGDGETVKLKCPGIVQAMLMLAGDAFRNREDTYAEPRLVAVNRKVINGVTRYAGRYRILNSHA